MKPLLISRSDAAGGAARAAFRLHQALLSSGVQSHMRVGVKRSDLATVEGAKGKVGLALGLLRPSLGDQLMRCQKSHDTIRRSPALVPSGMVRELNRSDADVLNLHWVNGEYLSIENIGHLRKPLVWTLHDMWAFCGAEHLSTTDDLARWKVGYRADNRPASHRGLDLDRWVWGRKRRAWKRPIHIVTPSRWLANCVSASAIMHEWPVTVIPNPLNTRQFQPWPKALARAVLGLPELVPLVMFGASGGIKDHSKGWDLLQPALAAIVGQIPRVECIIFGQSEPASPPRLGLPLHWMGHLNDDASLSLLYSAADVMVVPSRQENLPQSGTEAQACGCPVVAFNATGLPDVVEHKITGFLASPYDSADLAYGIRWVLKDACRYIALSAAARQRALRLWTWETVTPQYMSVYESAIAANHGEI